MTAVTAASQAITPTTSDVGNNADGGPGCFNGAFGGCGGGRYLPPQIIDGPVGIWRQSRNVLHVSTISHRRASLMTNEPFGQGSGR